MVAAQEAQAQAILQQARVSGAGGDLGGGRGMVGKEDSRRGWKGRLSECEAGDVWVGLGLRGRLGRI